MLKKITKILTNKYVLASVFFLVWMLFVDQRDYFQQQNAAGFDYAYTFPGMNRVLQAIGRVIRSETDRGVVLLIDARFNEPRYRRLFPAWWRYVRVRNPDRLRAAVSDFWKQLS